MARKKSTPQPEPPRWLGGERLRVSIDDPTQGVPNFPLFLGQPDQDVAWRGQGLDSSTFDRLSSADLLELLVDVSPEFSKALWDFLRMMNPGWDVSALRPGTKTPDKRAQSVLDGFFSMLESLYGSADVPINQLNFAAFLRGGFLGELVLDDAGRAPVDFATPDPRWLYHERVPDPQRGFRWRPFQWQMGQKIFLDRETVRYVPVDPRPGRPMGRPLATPALFCVLFALGLLHDLRRVVAQQGYPRIDIAINIEKLKAAMPKGMENDPAAFMKWVAAVVTEVKAAYAVLQPDDAYLHPDYIEVNRPVGTVDASSLGSIDGLMAMLEREAIRGLKSLPILFGVSDGVSEAHANRQFEIWLAGIRALQHLHESMWQHMLRIVLRVQGIQADIEFRFAEIRAAELLRDAQVALLEARVALARYQAGWIGQAQAAKDGAGVDKPDQPAPREPVTALGAGGGGSQNPSAVSAVPGSTKALGTTHTRGITPAGSLALPPVPDEVTVSEGEVDKAVAAWDGALPEYKGLLEAAVV